MRNACRVILLGLSLLASAPLSADVSILTEDEQRWLADHPTITIAPDPGFAPIEYFDEKGIYQGIAADYIRAIEEVLGYRFNIVQLESWDEVLTQAKSKQIDMFGAATSTPQRREYMNFSDNYIELPGMIFASNPEISSLSLKQLHGKTVAVAAGYIWHDMLSLEHPEIKIHPASSVLDGLQLLSTGGVDAMIANPATATYYIEKGGITNLRIVGDSGYFIKLAFAVRNDWQELIPILNKGIQQIPEQQRRAIYQRWVHLQQKPIYDSPEFWISTIGATAFILFFISLFWNYTLKKQVEVQTSRLQLELEQRIKTEERLRNSEKRYATLFDSASDAIFVMEGDTIIECNTATSHMFGCSKETYIAYPIDHFSPEKQPDSTDSKRKFKIFINLAYRGKNKVFEWQHKRHNGERFDAEVSLAAFNSNNKDYILAIVRDITERKRVDRMKDEFISTVSHEIRTPLTSIKGSLGLLEGGIAGELTEKSQQLISLAHKNTERLLTLVNDLLDIQKLDSGQMTFNLQKEGLSDFIHNAVAAITPMGDSLGVKYKIGEIEETELLIDVTRMMQVMDNILSNATKFSPTEGVVEIRARSDAHYATICITDHGPGIPASFLPHIFERFTQADASDTKKVGGTGLGLSIAKAIVEQHHGSIRIASTINEGTTFYVELPIHQPI